MRIKTRCYKGITGRHIDDVKTDLEIKGWEYCGIDIVDGRMIHGFECGDTDMHVWVDGAGTCENVAEDIL